MTRRSNSIKPGIKNIFFILAATIFILLSQGCGILIYGVGPRFGNPDKKSDSANLYNKQVKSAANIMEIIIKSFPEELPDWERTNFDLKYPRTFDSQYCNFGPVLLKNDFRRRDGSSNIQTSIIINPSIGQTNWPPVTSIISNNAKPISLNYGISGWLNFDYRWNLFLPDYDKRQESLNACMAQIFIGDWRSETMSSEFKPNSTRPPLPIKLTPASPPSKYDSKINPRCIAVWVIGRNEVEVMEMVNRINLKQLRKITDNI